MAAYALAPPFADMAGRARSAFGILNAPTMSSIRLLEGWLDGGSDFQLRILAAVYPTCETGHDELAAFKLLVEDFQPKVQVRVLALDALDSRAANALCFVDRVGEGVHLVVGSASSLSAEPTKPGQVGFVFRAEPALAESFKRFFDLSWFNALDIFAPGATEIPALVVPPGSEEAQRRWNAYMCLGEKVAAPDEVEIRVDPVTGQVEVVTPGGEPVPSPTEEVGLPKLDPVAERIARLYEAGALVSIDKAGRIPPLDAPVDPRLFGDAAALIKGSVLRKLSFRASVIDEATLKSIDKHRKGLRTLLNRFSFALADNMRWIPHAARELFEAEMARLNTEGQQLIRSLLSGGVEAFIAERRQSLMKDLGDMHTELGLSGQLPVNVVESVVANVTKRLERATTADLLPTVSYSSIGFRRGESAGASPWGQAYSLISDIAAFPRKALTDPFFFRGLKCDQEDLIDAMNVADDALLRDRSVRSLRDRCRDELVLLGRIDCVTDARQRCGLVCRLIAGDDVVGIHCDVDTLTERTS